MTPLTTDCSITARAELNLFNRTGQINGAEYSAGGILKVFMPNIVMIDFADDAKGKIILDFNSMAATRLVKAFQA